MQVRPSAVTSSCLACRLPAHTVTEASRDDRSSMIAPISTCARDDISASRLCSCGPSSGREGMLSHVDSALYVIDPPPIITPFWRFSHLNRVFSANMAVIILFHFPRLFPRLVIAQINCLRLIFRHSPRSDKHRGHTYNTHLHQPTHNPLTQQPT